MKLSVSLTYCFSVSFKQFILLIDPLGLGADGQLHEGASVEAQPAAALLQDLPRFVGEADGDVGFVHSSLLLRCFRFVSG